MILGILPDLPPGLTWEEIREQWPDANPPGKARLLEALHRGFETKKWSRDGEGKKGSPFLDGFGATA